MIPNVTTIITSIGTLMGVVGAIITAVVMIQRNSRDQRNELINGLSTLTTKLQDRINSLEKDYTECQSELKDLRKIRDDSDGQIRAARLDAAVNKDILDNVKKSALDLGLTLSDIGVLLPPRSTSIIVVGSDTRITDVVKTLLGNYGYAVQAAKSEDEALRFASGISPQTIGATIIDILTPDIDSIALIGKMRLIPGLHQLPAIIIIDFKDQSDRIVNILNTQLPTDVMLINFPFKQSQLIEMLKNLILRSNKKQ